MELEKSRLGLLSIRFILIHAFLPILVGALIYTFWRKPTLLVFSWYDFVGLNEQIIQWRSSAQAVRAVLPNWFLFCLPDGLWVYGITAFMAALWINAPKAYFIFWISVGPILAIGGELGQLIGFVQGTYELTDIAFYLVGFTVAVSVALGKNKRVNYEKDCLV